MTCRGSMHSVLFYMLWLEAKLFLFDPLIPFVLLFSVDMSAVLAICPAVGGAVKADAQNSVLQLRYRAHFVLFALQFPLTVPLS